MARKVDPITLAVVQGVLEATQREMTFTLEKTARCSVFNTAHDYSNAIFNHVPEMILRRQDIPIHLGSLTPAMKTVGAFSAMRFMRAMSSTTTIRATWAATSSTAACTIQSFRRVSCSG